MAAQKIADYFAQIGIRVNIKQINAFTKQLDQIEKKLLNIQRLSAKSLKSSATAQTRLNGTYAKGIALQQKDLRTSILSSKAKAESFKAQLQQSKLVQTGQQASIKLQQQQAKLAADNSRKLAASERLQQTRMRTQSLQSRIQQRTSVFNNLISSASFGSGSSQAFIGGGSGAAIGRFISGLHPATAALGAFTTAVSGVVLATKKFADASVREGEAGAALTRQFQAVVPDKQVGKQIEQNFYNTANNLGINAKASGLEYIKSVRGLYDNGMKLNAAEKMVTSVLAFGKANSLDIQRQTLALTAIGQMAGKSQLYAEEWRSQFSEHLPGANKLGVEAYGRMNNLDTSTESGMSNARRKFSKDMADGKIKDAVLLKFLEELSVSLEAGANRGGLLDKARMTHESEQNRLQNIKDANLRSAYDLQMAASRKELDLAQQELATSLTLLHENFGDLASSTLSASAELTRMAADVSWWFSKYLPKDSNIAKPTNSAESKAYIDNLLRFKVQDERDPTQQRDMTDMERRAAMVKVAAERARLAGKEYTFTDALRTSTSNLFKSPDQMKLSANADQYSRTYLDRIHSAKQRMLESLPSENARSQLERLQAPKTGAALLQQQPTIINNNTTQNINVGDINIREAISENDFKEKFRNELGHTIGSTLVNIPVTE